MKNFRSHLILAIAMLLYLLLWFFLKPWLGYLLDSDGVAYLTIAKRVADQQYLESINGLWSPLNSWIIAPFIKHGYDAWTIAKNLNCIFGAMVLILVHFLFLKFKLNSFAHLALMKASAIVLAYAVYFQMFGDVLQLIFVLAYLLILFSEKFTSNISKALLCGIIMAIGFYAKAYTLVFFLFHFAVCLYWMYRQHKIEKGKAVRFYMVGLFSAILLILPWTFALHNKYNVWAFTGLAGKLNMSWYINSSKSFKKEITLLIPPSYSDSPSFWEDPYLTQENLNGPLSSGKHFVKWIARVAHTTLSATQCFNEISFFALAILCISLYYFFFRKNKDRNELSTQLLLLTILILPLGYLMMHIETRYIWLNIFLLMIAGVILVEKVQTFLHLFLYKISIVVLSLSFISFPILQIESLRYKNKDLFDMADTIHKNNIHGSFSSNANDAGRMWVIAYLSHNPFYTIERTEYTAEELITEMKRYKVTYFLYASENNKSVLKLDENNFTFKMKADGFDVFELKDIQQIIPAP